MRLQREEQAAAVPIAPPVRRQHHNKGVVIEDVEDCLVKFAQCCNPVPGDPVIGFITRGYGVSVHRRDCTNVPKDMDTAPTRERWVSVRWEEDVDTAFHANLYIVAHNGVNLLLKLTTVLAGMHIPVHAINARDQGDGAVVNSVEHLTYVMQRLRAIDGVDEVQRTGMG